MGGREGGRDSETERETEAETTWNCFLWVSFTPITN
jgi:hypothetical protein